MILLVSFHALMCLGKLVWLDKPCIISQKVSTHDSVELLPKGFSFFLLGHKADCFFEGNRVIPQYNSSGDNPDEPFQKYLKSCSLLFPFHPQLWLHEDGTIPTHSWFIHQLCHHFPSDITGVWLPRRIRTVFFLVLVLVFKFKFFKKNSPSHFGLSSDLLILTGAYSALPCCWLIPIISCSTTDTTPLKCLSLRLASVQILTTETQLVSSSTSAVIGLSFLLTYTLATDKIT